MTAMLVPVIDGKEVDDQALAQIGRIVGDRIARLASERGWTQGQIAQNMTPKRSQGTVSMFMRGGIVDPPISTLIAFARLFNVTLDELVGFAPLPQAQAPQPPSAEADTPTETLRQELLESTRRQAEIIGQLELMQQALTKAGLLDAQSKPGKKQRAV